MESAGSAGKGCGDAAYKDGIPSGNRKLNAGIGKTGKNRNPLERHSLSDAKTGGNRLVYGYFYTDGVCSRT